LLLLGKGIVLSVSSNISVIIKYQIGEGFVIKTRDVGP
jgi:hypothetical protein